ncbi:uncharacterized protein LOC114246586 isoform X3 [Bombyx mandarina]|uniref:Uncharacterized protein LOC114246586 isoform X3 n=1 Tax=Bombyx mandarina TaxID=7092 RepID=A0A6J2K3U8_BOMMA|nr:uncharacterized protein LOC114246586 isoform X3 [Bombyx mandarina]
MKPLFYIVVTCLILAIKAHPENIEDVKDLPQANEPVLEAEESEPQARIERCTTCTQNLKLSSPTDVLAAIKNLPGEVHTQQSFEGCSTEKGCAGIKLKDGKVVEKFGDVESFKNAAALDKSKEFTFHQAGTFGKLIEGKIPDNGPFWWMNQNSPFKNTGGFEKFSKASSSYTSATGGGIDLAGNPFLNGDFSKLGAGFAGAGAVGQPTNNFQSSAFESSSTYSSSGGLDVSGNPFLNGGVRLGQGGIGGGQGVAGAQGIGGGQIGQGFAQNAFAGSAQNGFGYTGSSPRPFSASTPGSNVNLIQNAQKGGGYEYEQNAQSVDEAFQSTGNVITPDNGGEIQQTCAGQGYVCVPRTQCNNGIVSANGAALLQANTQKQYCNVRSEICCRIEISGLAGAGSIQGSLGVDSASYSGQGTNLFATNQGAANNFGAFDSANRASSFGASNFGSGAAVNRAFDSRGASGISTIGSTLVPPTTAGRFGSTGFGNEVFKATSQSNFIETDSFSAGSDVASSYRPGAIGSGLKPGIPYLPPVDNTNSGSNVVTSTAFPTTFVTTPRPFSTPRPVTPKPTYLPPIIPSTSAPGYLPPVADSSNNRETRLPPNKVYNEGSVILDETRQPTTRPTVFTPGPSPSEIPAGCAAALKCTPIEFCTAEGVISNTSVILSREQDAYRVPLTDCKDLGSGRIGKCCRDPFYTDPWPTNQLGKWVPGVFGGNDGKYVPDSRVSPSTNVRPQVTGRPPTSPSTGSVILNNFRNTPKPISPTPGPNQLSPGYPSSTLAPAFVQKNQFNQGSYGQKGVGQGSVIGVGQNGQGNQGSYGQGSQFTQTSSSRGQGQFPGVGQGQFPGAGQGQFPGAGQGQFPGAGQGQFPGAGQGQFPGVGQGQFPGAGQGQFPGAGQGQFPGAGQGQFPGAGQTGIQGVDVGVTQGFGQGASQGIGQQAIFGQGNRGQFGQGTQTVFGQGQGVSQKKGFGVSQGAGVGIRNQGAGQGTRVTSDQGQVYDQGVVQTVQQGVVTAAQQGAGQGVKYGQGQGFQQGGGVSVSQGSYGQGESQGAGISASRGSGLAVNKGAGFGVNQGTGQGQSGGFGVSQSTGQGFSQGTGLGVNQGTEEGIIQNGGFGVVRGSGTAITQGGGFAISQETGQESSFRVNQGSAGQGISQSGGFGNGQGAGQGGFGQGGSFGVVQGGGFGVRGQGFGVNRGVGIAVTGGQGEAINQGFGQGVYNGGGFGTGQRLVSGRGQALVQGEGQTVIQGVGTGVRQSQGFTVTQGNGVGVENEYSASTQRVFLKRYSGGGQCGLLNPQKPYGNRNDLEVDFAEIPWQAMVLLQTNRSLLCGGVITRPEVVVTSASCVDGLDAKNVLIKGGEWKLGIDDEPLPFQIVQVKTIIRHPEYKKGSLKYDAAILVLSENLRFAKNIQPICLPAAGETLDAYYNGAGECMVTGWGKIVLQAHLSGSIMHSLNVSLINPGECEAKLSQDYPHLLEQYDQDSCACGQPTNPLNNICKVDIGSALACTTGDSHFVLRGVYSWDSGCQVGNQIAGFYKFDIEWYEWAIGLIESVRFTKYTIGTKLTQSKITSQVSSVKTSQYTAGVKGVNEVGQVKADGLAQGQFAVKDDGFAQGQFAAKDDKFALGQFAAKGDGFAQGQFAAKGDGFAKGQFAAKGDGFAQGQFATKGDGFAQGQFAANTDSKTQGFTGQFNQYGTKFSEVKAGEGISFDTQVKGPISNTFSATYTEKKVYQSEPKIVTYTTKPEIVTFTTKPEYFTYTTKPKIVRYTTKPEIVTFTTKPEYFTYTTKPKIVTYTTKPQLITYETSGSGTNPQYVAPGVSFNPSLTDALHKHDGQCKCLEGKK